MSRILLFLACLFLGMGIGMFFGHTGPGTVIGMGVGLLAIAIAPSGRGTVNIRIGSRRFPGIGRLFLGVVGAGFIIWGLEDLGLITIPGTIWQHIGAFILVLIGIVFLYFALS
ncbi:MAG: hypothetical protein GXO43_01900 [Crenarchaeota archaeon]|nr:hypothetical protein [Thermoproteota archaeon]